MTDFETIKYLSELPDALGEEGIILDVVIRAIGIQFKYVIDDGVRAELNTTISLLELKHVTDTKELIDVSVAGAVEQVKAYHSAMVRELDDKRRI